MKHLIILCISVFLTLCAHASSKAQADSAYAKEDYQMAVRLYQGVEPSAAVCYNLGNCYYRMDEIAKAILWYERASLLSPGDADTRFNLDLARSKTVDKIVPRHEFFFVGWWRSFVNIMNVDSWAYWAISLFVLLAVSLLVYIYTSPLWLRKSAFTVSVVSLLLCILSNLSGFYQRYRLEHRTSAIVMTAAVTVKSTPAQSGSDLFVVHEGTRIEICDDSLLEWVEVELADGKKGWVEKKQIEVI